MAKARYFGEVKKFTSLHGSELLTDGDFTIRKLAERSFFSEATHHITDPNMLVCSAADKILKLARAARAVEILLDAIAQAREGEEIPDWLDEAEDSAMDALRSGEVA